MNAVEAALRRIVGRLDDLDARWAVIGGLAVSARCEPRFTRDVDVCVLVQDDTDAERLLAALVATGHAIEGLVEQDARGRLATARLVAAPGRS